MEQFLTAETLFTEVLLVVSLVAMAVRRLRLPCTVALLVAGLLLAACSPSSPSARYKSQADQFAAEQRLAESILTYRQALKSHPDDPQVMRELGTALASEGRDRSAAAILIRAADLLPADTSITSALAGLNTRPEDGLSLRLAWFATGRGSEPLGAAAAGGRIFIVYADSHLVALDEASGLVLWDIEAPAPLVSPPAADATQVWVGAEDGSILVYEAPSGHTLGHYLTKGAVYAAPALGSDLAYCPSNDGSLYALDRRSFAPVWKAELGDALHVSPLVSDGAVYVGSIDGRLYALNTSTGERIWAHGILTQGPVESVPALADGRVFAGSGDGRVYALDAATGGEYWRYSTPDAIYASPLVLGDQLLVASSGRLLASLRRVDGVPTWRLVFDHPIVQNPAFLKDQLYLVTRGDPRLFAVDRRTGALVGAINTGDWVASGPIASGTDLILVGQDGAVFLYR